jgi:hypothetical protein
MVGRHSAQDRAMKGPQGWLAVSLAFVGFGIAGLALVAWAMRRSGTALP